MRASDIVIRQAVFSDINDIVPLLEELFAIEEDFTFNEPAQRQGLMMMLDNNKGRCIMLAETDGKVIGMCSIQTFISTAEGGVVGNVEDMVVSSAYRGKGIGRLLLEAIEKWARVHHIKRLQLLADVNNSPAFTFYKKLYWEKTQLICLRKKI